MLPSILPLTPNHSLPLIHKPHFHTVSLRPFSRSHICFAFSPSNQNHIGEEARWLREEQRWLREEQRWLREESRWNAERQALLQEISSLKLRIQELERLNSHQGASVSETVANIAKLVQVLKEGDLAKNVNRIADSGTSSVPFVVEDAEAEEEIIVKEVISTPAKKEIIVKEIISTPEKKEVLKKRATLRKGSEGDEVRAMQEALEILGFYSGEEDIEYSSFSSGTERAVKTWQSTLGTPEDGIMTAELLEKLFGNSGSEIAKNVEHKASDLDKNANGALIASITDISEVQQTIVTEEGVTEIGVSEHRVFLLGENRWEEPSRLTNRGKNTATRNINVNAINKCLTCRGEGRLLCMECDGTGEPNIEEQFLDWVGEEAKCPYCEGHGFITCDVCGGKADAKA